MKLAIPGSSSMIRIRFTLPTSTVCISSSCGSAWSTGRMISNRAPAPGRLVTRTRPPCASAIARTIASPIPVPS